MKLVRESISFKRNLDPKEALGIGLKPRIKQWFDEWASNAIYTINDDLSIIVEGDLDLRNTQITYLPDNLTIEGSLDLQNTQITKLPDNLTVEGNLYLKNTPITKLPDNLTVKGNLWIKNTKIKSLPDTLKVEGDIYKDFFNMKL